MALATLGSKFLGLLRDVVLTDRLSTGGAVSLYVLASVVPLTVFAAVMASISTVFIPSVASLLQQGDHRRAEEFAANLNGAATLVVALLVVLLEIFARPFVGLLAPSLRSEEPNAFMTTVDMVRIMAPLILFYTWSAVAGGVLNSYGYFGPNAAMGIPQNLVIIGAVIIGSLGFGGIRAAAWGSLIGTSTTFLIQVPALRKIHFHFRWRLDLRDPLLLRAAGLMGPAMAVALANQAALLVDRVLAFGLRPQSLITDLTWALRLQGFAYGVLGYSVATVLYPRLAEAAVEGSDPARLREVVTRGISMVNFVTLPTMMGLFVLRRPIMAAVFQHGDFKPADTVAGAYALAFFALGTLSFAWMDYLSRTLYALRNTKLPMVATFAGVAINIGLDLLLVRPMQQGGLALGTASAWTCSAFLLAWFLQRKTQVLDLGRIVRSGALMTVTAAASVGLALGVYDALLPLAHRAVLSVGVLFLAVLAAVVAYLALAFALRIQETKFVTVLLQSAWRRMRHASA